MRHYLKALIISGVAFYAAYNLIPTVRLGTDPKNIAIIVGAIFITSLIIKPIFSLILLPVTFLTFGFLSLGLNIGLIFGLTKFLPGFSIGAYNFPGTNLEGFVIPTANLNQIEAIVVVALIITIIQKVLHIIFE